MKRTFAEAMAHRRSYYSIGSDSPVLDEEIVHIIREAVKNVPSAFNSQSTRIVLLLGDEHKKLWNIVKETLKARISPIVKNCCDYIGVHINEKLSIGDLAERAGYSEYYFSRKFKQEMGCTITEYIMREKIERAKVLLSTTNMSILDISIELSFNSRSYFSDSFQKIAGIAPGEYRKQNIRL